jgi:hypothetical protein
MHKPTTPNTITQEIRQFCSSIDSTQQPVYLAVQPAQGAEYRQCFPNVARKQQQAGGAIQHGWVIWESPGNFLEAEFHAVWVSPDGKRIDVTPQPDKEKTILFLPDSVRVWDGTPVHNFRKALRDDPAVQAFLIFGDAWDELRIRFHEAETDKLGGGTSHLSFRSTPKDRAEQRKRTRRRLKRKG